MDEAELDQIADLTIDDDGHEPIPTQRDLDKGSTETDAKEQNEEVPTIYVSLWPHQISFVMLFI